MQLQRDLGRVNQSKNLFKNSTIFFQSLNSLNISLFLFFSLMPIDHSDSLMVIVSILMEMTLDWMCFWRIGLYSWIFGNNIFFHLHFIVWQNISIKKLIDNRCFFFTMFALFFCLDRCGCIQVFKWTPKKKKFGSRHLFYL